MSTQTYSGQTLSLSQLAFALNQELKRSIHSSSLTCDGAEELEREVSAALATIREWRNSSVEINRIPEDVLSLIPSHLPSQKDRLRASFVCRHWRGTFIRRADLWSQLFLSRGEEYVKALLDRARGIALDIIVPEKITADTIALLSPHTQKFRYLEFLGDWTEITKFTEINSGPLPLLHTLVIHPNEEYSRYRGLANMMAPFPQLFPSAANLKVFRLTSTRNWTPFVGDFRFPTLTSLDLSIREFGGSRALDLLDFLEVSPTLQTVNLRINDKIPIHNIPQDRIVVLPNVESFSLTVATGIPGYEFATHIVCPSARQTSLTHKAHYIGRIPDEIFPPSILWSAIVGQYTTSPVEEVTFRIKATELIGSQLIFLSEDGEAIELSFEVTSNNEYPHPPATEQYSRVFTQGARTIYTHPQVASIKRLRILQGSLPSIQTSHIPQMVDEVGRLFKSIGPLDSLGLHNCDLEPYFCRNPNVSQDGIAEPVSFARIKEFEVSKPVSGPTGWGWLALVVEFAKSQHELGIPIERAVICSELVSQEELEELELWVGSMEYELLVTIVEYDCVLMCSPDWRAPW